MFGDFYFNLFMEFVDGWYMQNARVLSCHDLRAIHCQTYLLSYLKNLRLRRAF